MDSRKLTAVELSMVLGEMEGRIMEVPAGYLDRCVGCAVRCVTGIPEYDLPHLGWYSARDQDPIDDVLRSLEKAGLA